jgi:5-methylcytosine-specific restriction endonuclease McrA
VNRIPSNRPRLRLDPESYERLREQVLRRDGWRCQSCGAMSSLEVHHNEFRSHGGSDSEENLITLCGGCHSLTHRLKDRAKLSGKIGRSSS